MIQTAERAWCAQRTLGDGEIGIVADGANHVSLARRIGQAEIAFPRRGRWDCSVSLAPSVAWVVSAVTSVSFRESEVLALVVRGFHFPLGSGCEWRRRSAI